MINSFVGDNRGHLYKIDLFSGDLVWEIQCGVSIRMTPKISEGIVLFSTNAGKYRAVSLASGDDLWTHAIGLIADSSPAIQEGISRKRGILNGGKC